MNLSERAIKAISVVGLCVLLVQGALSFSDIDRVGWGLVAAYLATVVIYIRLRARSVLPSAHPAPTD